MDLFKQIFNAQINKKIYILARSLFLTTALLSTLQAQAQVEYTLTNLGAYTPWAINNSGQIAGYSRINNNDVPFFMDATGITQLAPASNSYLRLNNNGQVLAHGPTETSYIWQRVDGVDTYTNIPFQAYGLNDAGVAVGTRNSGVMGGNLVYSSVLYRDGNVIELTDARSYEYAIDINNSGQIVGDFAEGVGIKYENGAITTGPRGQNINNIGTILTPTYGWSLYQDGIVVNLGNMTPTELNDYNQVVGAGYGGDTFLTYASLWSNEQIYNLNSLIDNPDGLYLAIATDINERGQIVGYGYGPQESGFQQFGFLLSPINFVEPETYVLSSVPEPETYAMMLVGIGMIGFMVRRRKNTQD